MVRWLNIAALLVEHKDEITADLIRLYRDGSITETAFCCTLVPEGDPVLDKAAELARRFAVFQKELADSGMPVGLLLQATIGHGWVPDSPSPFQKLVRRDGAEPYQFCPLGAEFRAYIAAAIRTLAPLKPAFFMVDDDFRMYTGRPGCFCPLHLSEFSRRTGISYTRESLIAAVEADPAVARAYDAFLCESLVDVATIIRRTMDEADPAIPGSFSACAGDMRHAPVIARALAAPGQRPLVRINNGLYLNDSPRAFPQWLYRTAVQVAALPDDIEVLSEPDTCPHNRYSTSATLMHAHNTLSLLEGCRGGKLWMTRLWSYEPGSGKAYRDTLAQHAGWYRTLAELNPEWNGVNMLMPEKPVFNFPFMTDGFGGVQNWGGSVLGRMGLPIHYGSNMRGVTALAGAETAFFDDETLSRLLRGKVLLDGSAARELCRRGFAEQLGVDAREWSGKRVSTEHPASGGIIPAFGACPVVELIPRSPATQTLSRLCHTPFHFSPDEVELSPGATCFANAGGGTVVTLAAMLRDGGFERFFFLNETRKRQLVSLLNMLDPLPLYYPGDAEILLKAGSTDSGLILAALNIGLDVVDELPLAGMCARAGRIERLTPEGQWEPIRHAATPEGVTLFASLPPLASLICRFRDATR